MMEWLMQKIRIKMGMDWIQKKMMTEPESTSTAEDADCDGVLTAQDWMMEMPHWVLRFTMSIVMISDISRL